MTYLPRSEEVHFSFEVLTSETRKRIFPPKCSSSERGSAFFFRSALRRNAEGHFASELLSAGTGKRIFLPNCSSPKHGRPFICQSAPARCEEAKTICLLVPCT